MKAMDIPVGHLAFSTESNTLSPSNDLSCGDVAYVIRLEKHIVFITSLEILWDCLPIENANDDYEDLGRVSEVITSAGKTVKIGKSL